MCLNIIRIYELMIRELLGFYVLEGYSVSLAVFLSKVSVGMEGNG